MASAGTITIDFAAETARFTAEMKKVRNELTEIRLSSAATAKSIAALGSGFRNVIGLVSAGLGLRAVISNTEESEAAIAQLDNAIAKIGANVEVVSNDFQGFAVELQRVSTFSDEAIMSVETLLLSFRGLSSGTIKRATADILDLSARLGIDLETAAKTVGRALEDPVAGMTALRKAGVLLSDAQKKQIKNFVEVGDKAKAQQVILQELEARFKGSAAAARDTFGGALTGLKNAAGDLLEAKSGLPALTSEVNELSNFLNDPVTKQSADNLLAGLLSGATKLVEVIGKTAAGLQILITGKGGNAIVDIDLQIEKLTRDIQRLHQENATGELPQRIIDANLREIEAVQKRIQELLAEQKKLISQSQMLQSPATAVAAPEFTTPEAPGPSDAEIQRMQAFDTMMEDFRAKQLEQFRALDEDLTKQRMDSMETRLQADIDFQNRVLENERQVNARRVAETMAAENAIVAQKQMAAELAIGLLQVFARRSKSAAIALVAINKGMAIAKAVQDTAVAANAALAYVPWPANIAAAASIKAWGAVNVGIIAATGFAEAQQINASGGAPVGSSINPVFTRPTSTDPSDSGSVSDSQKVTQIVFAGPIFETNDARRFIVDAIKEETDRDVIVISPNSRNGQDLRGVSG